MLFTPPLLITMLPIGYFREMIVTLLVQNCESARPKVGLDWNFKDGALELSRDKEG